MGGWAEGCRSGLMCCRQSLAWGGSWARPAQGRLSGVVADVARTLGQNCRNLRSVRAPQCRTDCSDATLDHSRRSAFLTYFYLHAGLHFYLHAGLARSVDAASYCKLQDALLWRRDEMDRKPFAHAAEIYKAGQKWESSLAHKCIHVGTRRRVQLQCGPGRSAGQSLG